MAAWFPNGVKTGDVIHKIVPGGYAVVGRLSQFIAQHILIYIYFFVFQKRRKNLRRDRAKPKSLPVLFWRLDKQLTFYKKDL